MQEAAVWAVVYLLPGPSINPCERLLGFGIEKMADILACVVDQRLAQRALNVSLHQLRQIENLPKNDHPEISGFEVKADVIGRVVPPGRLGL